MEEVSSYIIIWKMAGDEKNQYETPITIMNSNIYAEYQFKLIMDALEKETTQRDKVRLINICKL